MCSQRSWPLPGKRDPFEMAVGDAQVVARNRLAKSRTAKENFPFSPAGGGEESGEGFQGGGFHKKAERSKPGSIMFLNTPPTTPPKPLQRWGPWLSAANGFQLKWENIFKTPYPCHPWRERGGQATPTVSTPLGFSFPPLGLSPVKRKTCWIHVHAQRCAPEHPSPVHHYTISRYQPYLPFYCFLLSWQKKWTISSSGAHPPKKATRRFEAGGKNIVSEWFPRSPPSVDLVQINYTPHGRSFDSFPSFLFTLKNSPSRFVLVAVVP